MSDQIRSAKPPVQSASRSPVDRNAVVAMILGLLAAAAILMWIYQMNHALQLRVEAAEVWSDYQVRIAKASIEEDPNLKQQYADEQAVLGRRAAELKDGSNSATYASRFSGFAALLIWLGTTAAVVALLSKNPYIGYAGILLSIVGIALEIKVFL